MQRNNIVITSGDPSGIGPEVTLKALESFNNSFSFTPIVICDYSFIEKYYLNNINITNYTIISSIDKIESGKINIYDIKSNIELKPGIPGVEPAKESLRYIDKSIELWKSGYADAVVTAPVSKGNIEKNSIKFRGHTEYFQEKTDSENSFMMMYSNKFRVILVSTHYSINEIPNYVNESNLKETIKMAIQTMKNIGKDNPVIGVCGLDPHCGDGGAVGSFDKDVTSKVVKLFQEDGCDVRGPFSADTIFIPHNWQKYDVVVAMYHDQGLIPFKILSFEDGVNLTLGMNMIRTSADHGTAFDIAGKNIASYNSMREAILLADKLVTNSH